MENISDQELVRTFCSREPFFNFVYVVIGTEIELVITNVV